MKLKPTKTENKIKKILLALGLSSEKSIIPYFPRVRDRADISVLKCKKSGVIFLSRSDHMDISYYDTKKDFKYSGLEKKPVLAAEREDAERRAEQFRELIASKKWLDVGAGTGKILDLLSPVAAKTAGVEPNKEARQDLEKLGYTVYPSTEKVTENNFDVVTLFHVLEHLTEPIEILKSIRDKMTTGGKLVIEVPHAGDLLISVLENEAFKAFTFWSEHLILHTRKSLETFLKTAGFSKITITGFQRHPLANHLYWEKEGKPGGHLVWEKLRTPELDTAYAEMLEKIDATDTLIAVAEK